MRWAGAAPAPEMTGRALASPEDTALSTEGPAFVYSHNDFEGFVLHSVRTQDAKLIESNAENTRAFSPTQLFDLGTDAAEQKNLAGQNDIREPDMTRTLQGMKDHVRGRAAEPSMIKEITDEEKDRLKAVGYM
jgi:hypothetical protein